MTNSKESLIESLEKIKNSLKIISGRCWPEVERHVQGSIAIIDGIMAQPSGYPVSDELSEISLETIEIELPDDILNRAFPATEDNGVALNSMAHPGSEDAPSEMRLLKDPDEQYRQVRACIERACEWNPRQGFNIDIDAATRGAIATMLRASEPDEGETAEEIYQRLSKMAAILGYELRKPEPVMKRESDAQITERIHVPAGYALVRLDCTLPKLADEQKGFLWVRADEVKNARYDLHRDGYAMPIYYVKSTLSKSEEQGWRGSDE